MTQGTVYKSVVRNAAYIFFIKLFPAFAAVVMLIVYSRYLPQEDYGRYQDFWVKLLLLGTLGYAGLPVTIITYPADTIKRFKVQLERKHFFFFFLWLLVWTMIFSVLGLKLDLPVWLSCGLLFLYAVHAVQEALLMASKKMNGLLFVNIVYAVYFLSVHFFFIENFDLVGLLKCLLPGMLLRAVVLGILIQLIYRKVPTASPLLSTTIGNARRLWLHLGLYDLLLTVFRYLDKFIIASFLPAALFAVYFNGAQSAEVPFLPYLLGAVASSILLQLSENQNNPAHSYKLLYQSGKVLSCIVFPLFFYLFFFSEELFTVVFTTKYIDSVPVFLVVLLVLPLRAYNYTTLLQHLHLGATINKGAILDLIVALVLMYPLYQLFGLQGVALSFVISTYVQVAYYLWQTSKAIQEPITKILPLKNWLGKFLFFGVLLLIIHFLLQSAFSHLIVLIAGAIAMTVLSLATIVLELKRSTRIR